MVIRERSLTVDDVWQLEQQPVTPAEQYYLIDGELIVKMAPRFAHAMIAGEIARLMGNFVAECGPGFVTIESGHYPQRRRETLLLPDVAFIRLGRVKDPSWDRYLPFMPDSAVEIVSPSQSLAAALRPLACGIVACAFTKPGYGADCRW